MDNLNRGGMERQTKS